MPMTLTSAKTPKGHTYLRTLSSGDVTTADAEALNRSIAMGGQYANLPILGLVEPGTNYSAEARKALTASPVVGGQQMPIAVVVSSAPMRVMLGFLIRISGAAEATKFFSNEAEALTWMDEKLSATRA